MLDTTWSSWPWAWASLALLFVVLEGALGASFVAIYFAAGALAAALVVATGLVQAPLAISLTFVGVSVGLLAATRRPLLRWARAKERKHPVDSLLGTEARVLEHMAPGALGAVSLHGSRWQARNAGTGGLAVKDLCRVVAIEGLTLSVRGPVVPS